MTRGLFPRLLGAPAAIAVALGWAGSAPAAEPVPAPIVAGPAVIAAPETFPTYPTSGTVGCETCGRGHISLFHNKKNSTPRVPYIAPGACFGYFQTQWHRWEDVCPIPYQAAGLTDGPPRPAPPIIPITPPADATKKGSDTPLPKKAALPTAPAPTTLPAIPPLPSKTSKF